MSTTQYNALPQGYALRTTTSFEPIPVGGMFMDRAYTVPTEFMDPIISFDQSGLLQASKPFLQPLSDRIMKVDLPEDSPFRSAFNALKSLVSATPFHHYTARTLLQNCARTLRSALRIYEEGHWSSEMASTVGLGLKRVFESTARAMAGIPEDAQPNVIPPSFVTVTQELRNAVENNALPTHVMSRFENDARLPYPLVIHPALDIAVETLQRSLQTIYKSHWNLHTLEATYTESIRAFDAVNTSLFLDPQDTIQKHLALLRNIEEFRRLYLRHSALVHACQWIAITLIGPYWLSGFREVCHYLAQTVERITGEPFSLNFARVENAIERDSKIIAGCWRGNIEIANQERCRNPRTCEALVDLAQMAVPGSYEYRALMHTMYELRRSLYRSLEAWEFVSSEITMGSILGEGGFATVRSCEWLGGVAAVKTFHQESSPAKRGTTTLTTENMSTYLHRRELEVWYRLAHPNVLPFLGACLIGPTPMILTPLSENGNARSYRSRYPNANWLKILFEIILGVEFLHKEAKIVHGDLKGANILINSQTSPQIADFGLAKMTENIYGHREFIGGTAQWMAPELLDRSGYLTYASDIYSLGMTLYELWYNKDPFELLEPDLVQEMVLEEELRPERESSPVILDELWSTIEGCWPTNLESRLSASAIVDRLKAFAAAFPERDPFPFISSRHLISFAVETQKAMYTYVTRMGHLHCETSQSAIPRHSTVLHPVERLTFRIQNDTYPYGIVMVAHKLDLPGPCRFEAVLLRRDESDETSWIELAEGKTTVLDVDARCNATVAHQVELDINSPVIRNALAGDKIGLRALVDTGYRCRVDYAEIEMRVRLDKEVELSNPVR
ncbi:hypothetical protein FS837_005212 [Tulasnella sp. UAMH 9824]|nr:hypothetical protein FS837_005212 [Tulasnella sp. UAMH 9824]